MNTELDPELLAVFKAYSPETPPDPFLSQILLTMKRTQRLKQIRTLLVWALAAVLVIALSPLLSRAIERLAMLVNWVGVVIDGRLHPWQVQSISYVLAAILLLLNRDRLKSLWRV